MKQVETTDTQFTPAATECFTKALVIYKRRLLANPDLSFRRFCHDIHVDYAGMSAWCHHNGIQLKALRKEVFEEKATDKPTAFVQIRPSYSTFTPESSCCHGVSITFPDGVNLTLQESSIEDLIRLLSIYQIRHGGMQVCSH